MKQSFEKGDVNYPRKCFVSSHQEQRVSRKNIVKLREREGQRVDPGRSLKGHLWMVDGGYPFPDALH